jgi:lipopolysaccharide transport system permease protein
MIEKSAPTNINRPTYHIRIQSEEGWSPINFSELWAFRDLFIILAMRDVRLRYKQTALGVIWVILQPLVASIIFAVIFGYFAKLPSDGPYLPFVFAGMLPWTLFASGLQRAGNSLISDQRLITKVYFPRIVIPIASTVAVLIDFAVAFVVMLGLLLLYRIPLTWHLLVLPCLLLIVIFITVGVSLLFSALNVYYRDFMYALPFIIQVWMYASPLVYAANLISAGWRTLYILNPMVGVLEGFRWALLGTEDFPMPAIVTAIVGSFVFFLSGAYIFNRVERSFADVI